MRRFATVGMAVALKDLRSEARGRELVPALAQFAVLALVIANFAFDIDRSNAARTAPGILWLALVFMGLLAFGRAFASEREMGSLEALLLTPAPAAAIFAGKAVAAALFLVICEAVLVPGLAIFFAVPITGPLVGAVLLATVGLAALGTLFGAIAAQTRAREALLPVLALPLWVPYAIVGGRAVQLAMGGGAPAGDQSLMLLAVLDILFVVVALAVAPLVLHE